MSTMALVPYVSGDECYLIIRCEYGSGHVDRYKFILGDLQVQLPKEVELPPVCHDGSPIERYVIITEEGHRLYTMPYEMGIGAQIIVRLQSRGSYA